MSTPPVQTAAPGTPGTAVTPPVTETAKSMVAAAFGEAAPAQPDKPTMPPVPGKKPAAEAAPAKPAEAAAKPAEVAPAKPAEAAPAKPADAAPEWPGEKMDLPANASPEQKQNFASMKTKFKEQWIEENRARAKAEKSLADAQAAVDAKARATPADTADLEAKTARLKAAEDRLAVLDLQSHPDFVRQFTQPKEKAVALAAEVLAYNGKEGVDLKPLLSKSMKDFNAAVSEFTKDMNTADAATVATSLREARALQANEAQALSQSSELRAALQAKTAREQQEAFESVAKSVDGILSIKEIPDGLSAEEKQEALAYNDAVRGLRANAEKKVFSRVSEKEVAGLAFKAETYDLMAAHVVPGLLKRAKAQDSVIADLTSQLKALNGNRAPAAGAGDVQPDAGKPATRADLIAAAYGKEKI